MDLENGERFMEEARQLTAAFDQSVSKWRDVYGPNDEWPQYRRLAGRVMGWLLIGIKRPLGRFYPHLEPIGGDSQCTLVPNLWEGDAKELIMDATDAVADLLCRYGHVVEDGPIPDLFAEFNEARPHLLSALREIRELLTHSRL